MFTNVEMQQANGFWSLLLRGCLGGLLGIFVFSAVEVCLLRPTGWDNWLGYFLIMSVIGSPFGLLVGPTLGVAIWFLRRETGIRFGLLSTAMIGTLAGAIAIAIWWSTTSERTTETIGLTNLFGGVLLGAAVGGVAGLVVGIRPVRHNPSATSNVSR